MRRKLPGALRVVTCFVLYTALFIAFTPGSTQKKALEDMTLEELLSVEILPARRDCPWPITMMLTLRIYGENLNFPYEKKKIRIATDSTEFLEEFTARSYGIRGKRVETVLISKKEKSFAGFDLAFIKGKRLAKKIAANGKTLIFSSKKSCSAAAFVITVVKKRFIIIPREKNIDAQGARYSTEFLANPPSGRR